MASLPLVGAHLIDFVARAFKVAATGGAQLARQLGGQVGGQVGDGLQDVLLGRRACGEASAGVCVLMALLGW